MRVGMVCPYSFDVPGGVQFHVRDLAEELIARGHFVSVLAPADDDTPVPPYVVPTGRAIPIHYNGSVARLSFGPLTAARTRRWLSDGNFDVLHIHEPITPSLGMLALWSASGPVVATFHSNQERSRALQIAFPMVRASRHKITGTIAVSEDARRTVIEHLGGDAVIVPNGVYVDRFAQASPNPAWQGTPEAPTIAFLGRLAEPRKGLEVLLAALPDLRDRLPGLRLLVAGNGEWADIVKANDCGRGRADAASGAPKVEFLGAVDEDDKAALLASVDVYVAPHTGGESFGIVLVEAMSAGAAVVASDLGAFRRVLDDGALGQLFSSGDPADLTRAVLETLTNRDRTAARVALASQQVRCYDWSAVASQVLAIYEMAIGGLEPTTPAGGTP